MITPFLIIIILFTLKCVPGVQNEVQVQFCACEADFLRHLRFNLWAATPLKPELAFSISLMDFLHALTLECQVAVKDFCVAVQSLADETFVFAVSVLVLYVNGL